MAETLPTYKELLQSALDEINAYEEKPTKAASLRIRKKSTELGKQGKFLRAELIEADKA
jgi:hypothetical protein